MKRILLIISAVWAMLTGLSAQELSIKGMRLDAGDLSASTYERKDMNGAACALVKVLLPIENAVFEGNVIGGVENKSGEYWVYMSQGSKELRVKHSNYLRLHVNFLDYGIERSGVKGKCTYTLTLIPYISSYMQNEQNGQHTQSVQAENLQVSAQQMNNTTDTSKSNIETFIVNGVSFNMVFVDGGTFTMGATSEQGSEAESDEKPAHQVTLSAYSIGETEVTQAVWQAVMGSNPSNWKGDNLPVEQVSWEDCQTFIQKLNQLTGRRFRLPTEAEWEYAARGGNKSLGYKYSGSNDIDFYDAAWYDINSNSQTQYVKTKQANELGLYDMSGNVWEWCQDWKANYSSSSQTNPTGPSSGSYRVFRGGSWLNYAWFCRVAIRNSSTPVSRSEDLGLRLAL